jgi:hypothetical protein
MFSNSSEENMYGILEKFVKYCHINKFIIVFITYNNLNICVLCLRKVQFVSILFIAEGEDDTSN